MDHPGDFTADTTPKALRVFYELQRARTIHQKLGDVIELSEMLMACAEAGGRMRHPGASEREVFLRAAALRLPRDIMIKVYGWDPAQHA